jgi:hypothetical protein
VSDVTFSTRFSRIQTHAILHCHVPFHERRLFNLFFLSYTNSPPLPAPEDDEDLAGSSAHVLLLLHGLRGKKCDDFTQHEQNRGSESSTTMFFPISTEAQKENRHRKC